MALTWQPLSPWHIVVSLLGGVMVVLLLARGLVGDRWRVLGSNTKYRVVWLFCSVLVAALLSAAAWNPVAVREPDPGKVHLSVVIDVSESVLRAEEGWSGIRERVATLLATGVAALPEELLEEGEASIVLFGAGVTARTTTLDALAGDFARLGSEDFARGDASDIGAGLTRALAEIEKSNGRGAIVLITDGNDTERESLKAAERAARLGIPIAILPVEGRDPELAISSADLAALAHEGEATLLRGVIFNQTQNAVGAHVSIALNDGLPADVESVFGAAARVESAPQQLESGEYVRLRTPVLFEGIGLQYVDAELLRDDGSTAHRRRFFVHVDRPVKLLAVGGDFDWIEAVAPGVAEVTGILPEAFSADIDLTAYDGVVLSSALYTDLDEQAVAKLVAAVERDGLGLMVFNGDHRGADEEAPTVLRTYHETLLDRILPVSTEPRPFEEEPPTRHVIIMVDTSGSMSGWQEVKARKIIQYIVENHLVRQDFLDLIVLGGIPIIEALPMIDANKPTVINALQNLPGGSSSLAEAMALLQNRQLSNCGLVIISDGEISGASFRPDCRTTVFAVNQGIPPNSPLYDFADPFPVGPDFSPAGIEIPYFEPEKRDKFFEPGAFEPLTLETATMLGGIVAVPNLPIDGAAISYARNEADVAAFRPKFADPVLAFREAGAGYVGVFAGGFSEAWLADEAGRKALEQWLLRIVPYAARDRYLFDVTDDGRYIDLTMTLRDEQGGLPDVQAVDISVQPDTLNGVVTLRPVPGSPATYRGVIQVERDEQAHPAVLAISETGPGALPRAQRVPFLVPPLGTVDLAQQTEAASFGLNRSLLEQIAAMTGGQYDVQPGAPLFRQDVQSAPVRAYWPWLATLAAFCYLGAILVRRLDRGGR